MKDRKMLPPPCKGISPDGCAGGYICLNCGRMLRETLTGWFRHTDVQKELPSRRQ
jgi:hypothetical protein